MSFIFLTSISNEKSAFFLTISFVCLRTSIDQLVQEITHWLMSFLSEYSFCVWLICICHHSHLQQHVQIKDSNGNNSNDSSNRVQKKVQAIYVQFYECRVSRCRQIFHRWLSHKLSEPNVTEAQTFRCFISYCHMNFCVYSNMIFFPLVHWMRNEIDIVFRQVS